MTTAAELFASDLDVLFNTEEHAETVSYNGTDIAAIVDRGESLKEVAGGAADFAVLLVKAADVARPTYKDTAVFDSLTWYVRRFLSGDNLTWEIEVYTNERPTRR